MLHVIVQYLSYRILSILQFFLLHSVFSWPLQVRAILTWFCMPNFLIIGVIVKTDLCCFVYTVHCNWQFSSDVLFFIHRIQCKTLFFLIECHNITIMPELLLNSLSSEYYTSQHVYALLGAMDALVSIIVNCCRNWNCWHIRRMQQNSHHSLQQQQVIQSHPQAVTTRYFVRVFCLLIFVAWYAWRFVWLVLRQVSMYYIQPFSCICLICSVVTIRDVKFVFSPNSNFVCKIRILFELRLGLWYLVFSRTFW